MAQTQGSTPDGKIAAAIVSAIARMSSKDPARLTNDTQIFLELGMDSVDILELLMHLEDELGIEFGSDTLDQRNLETIGTLTTYVTDQAGAQRQGAQ
jgi:acyl carrier protein